MQNNQGFFRTILGDFFGLGDFGIQLGHFLLGQLFFLENRA